MLKLPLKYYDESGRILPPKWLYAVLTVFSLDWIAFVFSLASRTQTETLLKIFYPQSESLGLALLGSFPMVVCLMLVSQRERLWKHNKIGWCRWLLPLLILGIAVSLSVQFYHVIAVKWGFESLTAAKIIVYLASLYCISRSRHIRWMLDDWKKPNY